MSARAKTTNETPAQLRKIANKMVMRILLHRRANRVREEQVAYLALKAWCELKKLDFINVLQGATAQLKKKSLAARMNGLV